MSDDPEEYKPGKVATLDQMLEMAREIAKYDTQDGLNTEHVQVKTRGVCSHVCQWPHHTDQTEAVRSCCCECDRCKANIRFIDKKKHIKKCHKGDVTTDKCDSKKS